MGDGDHQFVKTEGVMASDCAIEFDLEALIGMQ